MQNTSLRLLLDRRRFATIQSDMAAIQYPILRRPEERRCAARYPIKLEARYRTLGGREPAIAGQGETVDMSSSGILFTVQSEIRVGRMVELSISWPVLLNGACPMKFVAQGKVCRAADGRAALQMRQYEFRTKGTTVSV